MNRPCNFTVWSICSVYLFITLVIQIFCAQAVIVSKCAENGISSLTQVKGGNGRLQRWLGDARFIATCLDEFGTSDRYGRKSCKSVACRQCLKPCQNGGFSDLTGCKSTICKLESYCESGCNYYHTAFNNDTVNTLAPAKLSKPPFKMDNTTPNVLSLKWEESKSLRPTVFVVIREDAGVLIPFLLTTLSYAVIDGVTYCGFGIVSSHNQKASPKMLRFMVVPVNRFGWEEPIISSQMSTVIGFPRPAAPTGLSFHKPLKYGVGHRGDPIILLNTTWDTPKGPGVTNYAYIFYVERCSYAGVHFRRYTKGNKTSIVFQVENSKSDALKGCTVVVRVTAFVNCVEGWPGESRFNYEGCHTVQGFPSKYCVVPMPTQEPPQIVYRENLTVICTKWANFSCSVTKGPESLNCSNCTKGFASVVISWFVLPNATSVVKFLYGLDKVQEIGDIKFPVSVWRKTSYDPKMRSASFNLTRTSEYIFKVYPFVDLKAHSPAWSSVKGIKLQYRLPSVQKTTAIPTTAKPNRSTTKQETNSGGVMALTVGLSVLLGLTGVFCIGIFMTWQKQRKNGRHTENFHLAQHRDFNPPDSWEIHPSTLTLGTVIGEGAFGKVYIGALHKIVHEKGEESSTYAMTRYDFPDQRQGVSYTVAVKMLKVGTNEREREDFLKEIELMKRIGYHKNIIGILGCCTLNEPLCLVVEYMGYGDLLHYLRSKRAEIAISPLAGSQTGTPVKYLEMNAESSSSSLVHHSADVAKDSIKCMLKEKDIGCQEIQSILDITLNEPLQPDDVLSFGWQISAGMEYLAEQKLIHRDLAARNVLVGHGKTCKISDFGLSRNMVNEQIYFCSKNRKLPIKWMSIEAILRQEFTTMSDIWAFGVVLFEIVTLGGSPYPTIDNQALLDKLKNGYRMEQPDNCSDELYDIMTECWKEDPSMRPSFTALRKAIEQLIYKGTPYVTFHLDESKDYYNVPSFKSADMDSVSITDVQVESSCTEKRQESCNLSSQDESDLKDDCDQDKTSSLFVPHGVENCGFQRYVSSRLCDQHATEV